MAKKGWAAKPVRGLRSGRPIMALLDLLGRRWVLRILWELRDAALNFRALQAACGGLSPSVLNQRLGELRAAELVELAADGYRLTHRGRELFNLFGPLNHWAERWAKTLAR
ncbi:MAG: winged helix-turn-helix transcriptional regulator [Nevskiales bacterium]